MYMIELIVNAHAMHTILFPPLLKEWKEKCSAVVSGRGLRAGSLNNVGLGLLNLLNVSKQQSWRRSFDALPA